MKPKGKPSSQNIRQQPSSLNIQQGPQVDIEEASIASASEMTGLMPSMPEGQAQADRLAEIANVRAPKAPHVMDGKIGGKGSFKR